MAPAAAMTIRTDEMSWPEMSTAQMTPEKKAAKAPANQDRKGGDKLLSLRETGRLYHPVHDVPLTHFQVFGERASATNLVRKLIEKNIEIENAIGLGWKHSVPRMVAIPKSNLIVGVVRHAEAWALSMHKRPWHLDPRLHVFDFSRFIRTPWRGIVDRPTDFEELPRKLRDQVNGMPLQMDLHPITGRPYNNLFQMRAIKMASLLSFMNRGCNVVLLKAEQVQEDPEGFVDWFSETLSLKRRSETFQGIHRRLGNRHKLAVPDELRGSTPKEMSRQDRKFMRSALDMQLEELVGYTYPE